jgi:hypothetical protein
MKKIFLFLLLLLVINLSCEKKSDDAGSESTRKDFILAGETGDDIKYTDINPYWNRYAYGLSPDSINIDINGDHLTDISIRYSTLSSSSAYSVQTTVSSFNGAYYLDEPKDSNEIISASSGWINSTSILAFTKIDFSANDTSVSGSWISKKDKFLGVEVSKHGRKIFGWIRISLLIHPETVYIQQVIVKDFACMKD